MIRWIQTLALAALSGAAAFSGSLKIYTEVSPPYQIRSADGNLSGLAVEVVQEIQKRVGNADPIQVVPWTRGYNEVLSDPDVVLFSMGRTEDREPLFHWVGPISEITYSFFLKASSRIVIKSLDDAKKLGRIGVYKDDARDQFLTKAGFTNLDRTTDSATNVRKLMADRLDAFTSSRSGVADAVRAAGYHSEDVKESLPFFRVQLCLAFSRRTPEATVKAWQMALNAMKKDRTYEKIFHKYLPNQPLPK
jgi:polar amino acid transport system substrate-binding protein